MYGEQLQNGLEKLVTDFDRIVRPRHGRYVPEPAVTDENGVQYLPPVPFQPVAALLAATVALAGLWLILYAPNIVLKQTKIDRNE
jgi:hypothetical protein